MDFQTLIDSFAEASCVLSVEDKGTGKSPEIRLVAANRAYIDSLRYTEVQDAGNLPEDAPREGSSAPKPFVAGSLYQEYFPKDMNFEQYCLRCVSQGQTLHAYVYLEYLKYWFHCFMIPLSLCPDGKSYLVYTIRGDKEPDAFSMSNLRKDITGNVLATCIKLRSTKDYQKTMDEVIADIRKLCRASFGCILLVDTELETCSLLCENMADEAQFPPGVKWLDDTFYDNIASTWPALLGGSSSLIIQDQEEMQLIHQKNHIWYRSLMKAGVKSLVMLPLKFSDSLLGYIWVTNFDVRDVSLIKETLELTAYFLSSEIANKQLIQRLEMIGAQDALTGVFNRNEMGTRLDAIMTEKAPFYQMGILYADINGLKKTNDLKGHQYGDRLLQNGARILREVFPGCEIFRAGGDEFVVLKRGANPDIMEEAIRKVREEEEKNGTVCFALGYSIAKRRKSLRNAMREADEAMYEDKRRYYKEMAGKIRRTENR